ncbi:HEAT repeat domain-containing protein [bacterium]|nr:HEAT repeat domain-containing protein [bacterium]
MIKTSEMLELLNRHEFFMTDYLVAILNSIKGKKLPMEGKFLSFMKDSISFQPFGATTPNLRKYFQPGHIRNRVVSNLFDRHQAFFNLIGTLETKDEREVVNHQLISKMGGGKSCINGFSILILSRLGHIDAKKELFSRFKTFSRALRWGITAILGKTGESRWVSLFLLGLDDPEPETVRLAAFGLGWSGAVASSRKLVKLLFRRNVEVVLSAIKVLAQLRDSRSVPSLKRIAKESRFKKIRATAVSALGEFVEADTVPVLVRYLKDPEPRARANAVMALKRKLLSQKNLNPKVIREIKVLLNDKNNRVKADTIQALWDLGFVECILEIEPMLKDPNPRVRGSAAYLCGKLKLHQFKNRLIDLTDDPSWPVRRMAAISFLRLGEANKTTLESLMRNGTQKQQVSAAFALGLTGFTEAIDALVSRSSSDDEIAQLTGELWLQIPKTQESMKM